MIVSLFLYDRNNHHFTFRLILTSFSLSKTRLAVYLFICLGLLSACATTAKSPSAVNSVSFGEQPTNYKQLVKTYLDKKRKGAALDLNKVNFLNEPNKYIFQTFTQEKFGYRVCAIIPDENLKNLRSHFFLINNGKVTKHLSDSGIIPLSNKFCNTEILALERRVQPSPVVAEPVVAEPVAAKTVDKNGFKYISCQAKNNEIFFAFNPEKQQLLQQNDGKQIAEFDIQQLSETYIVATNTDSRVSINRISGTMLYQSKGIESKAHCELTSQQRF